MVYSFACNQTFVALRLFVVIFSLDVEINAICFDLFISFSELRLLWEHSIFQTSILLFVL